MAAFLGKKQKSTAAAAQTERDRWIHRDKLTQIEIQEYKDLGLEPPAELLRRAAESRQAAANAEQAAALRGIRSPSPYRYDENEEEDEYLHAQHTHEHYTRRANDNDDAESVFVPVDPRSPEEIEQDPYEENRYHEDEYEYVDGRTTPMLRKSNSKIPLAPYSQVPVPQEHLDRLSRLPRKRGASAGFDENSSPIAYPKTRRRQGSSSSAGYYEEDQPIASSPITSPATPSSPTKREQQKRSVSSKSTATVGKKKSPVAQTTPTTTTRPRAPSATPSRPGTSSGERPRTATNPPEGDPPWLSTMYKPDPRLPPDQQMLPTHAKRMMQEQLEREGKSGQMYDRDFNALNGFSADDEEAAQMARQQAGEELDRGKSPTTGDRSAQWPLSGDFSPRDPTPSPIKASINGSPDKKSISAGSGGYSAMPRLTDSPKPQIGLFPSPRIGSEPENPARNQSPKPQPPPKQQYPSPQFQQYQQQQPQQHQQQPQSQPGPQVATGNQTRVTGGLEEDEKKEKKSGGCGCCVVM